MNKLDECMLDAVQDPYGACRSKAKITECFGELLKLTENYRDLNKLVYVRESSYSEYVYIIFNNGTQKRINVSMDSTSALIRDVMVHIDNADCLRPSQMIELKEEESRVNE